MDIGCNQQEAGMGAVGSMVNPKAAIKEAYMHAIKMLY